jgi:hypothetical protein
VATHRSKSDSRKQKPKQHIMNERNIIHRLPALAAVWTIKATVGGLLLGASLPAMAAGNDNRAPEVPPEIAVDSSTNKVHFHGFGVGVQIYTWNGASWGPSVPDATLFDDDGNVVASHFVGPTWVSNSGSRVVGSVIQPTATVDTNAIPWVRLKAVIAEGPGIFANTSFIQRVNTTGGRAPAANGTVIGQVAAIPYTADYFFYRPAN